jgi:hypothetical protein
MGIMRYYIDTAGSYLGGWDANPPSGAIEVPFPPSDARQSWINGAWSDAPAIVPAKVTMRQARLALLAAGLLDDVEAAIDALPEPPRRAARIEWEFSSEVFRDRDFVLMLGQALGLDSEEMDALFIEAATL